MLTLPDLSDVIGPGPVSVVPDPGLLSADPSLMSATATQFAQMAEQVNTWGSHAGSAATELLSTWHGKAANQFSLYAEVIGESVTPAAEGLMGAAAALRLLSDQIDEAQQLARQAMALAEQTTAAAARLQTAYTATRTQAVAALPAGANRVQVVAAEAPTGAQEAQAEQLDGDAMQATAMMDRANQMARTAWQQAATTLDTVTAQSPSVQAAVVGVNVKVFSQTVDGQIPLAVIGMMAGMVSPDSGDDGGDDDDEPEGEFDLTGEDVQILHEEITLIDGTDVDGTTLDPAIGAAVDGNGITVGYTNSDTIEQAIEEYQLDPTLAPLFDGYDPYAGDTPEGFAANRDYWDPGANGGKGGWVYPPNNGAVPDTTENVTLEPGEITTRFGGTAGNFTSPIDTPFAERGLPPSSLTDSSGNLAYHEYEVVKPIPSDQSVVAPAFGQTGGGVQNYLLGPDGQPTSIQWLLDNGYLRVVPATP